MKNKRKQFPPPCPPKPKQTEVSYIAEAAIATARNTDTTTIKREMTFDINGRPRIISVETVLDAELTAGQIFTITRMTEALLRNIADVAGLESDDPQPEGKE